jgi:hypothetical protein
MMVEIRRVVKRNPVEKKGVDQIQRPRYDRDPMQQPSHAATRASGDIIARTMVVVDAGIESMQEQPAEAGPCRCCRRAIQCG